MKTRVVYWLGFGLALVSVCGCKKKDPIIDEKGDEKKVTLLLDKLTEKATMNVQVSEAGERADVVYTNHTHYQYTPDSLLVKTTKKFDQPAGIENFWSSEEDTYDTYEYTGGKLTKRSEFRRRYNQRNDPIELLRYATFQYNNAGKPSSMSSHSQIRTPPNGDFVFKESAVSNYTYDGQARLTRAENLNYRFDGGGQRVLSSKRVEEYAYGADGNISKLTEYLGFDNDGNGQIGSSEVVKSQELEYSGYGTQPNPVYSSGMPIAGIGFFSLFKHFPTTIKRTGFPPSDSGIPPVVSTDRYQFTHREDGYPATAKADLELKSVDQNGVIREEKRKVNYDFHYRP